MELQNWLTIALIGLGILAALFFAVLTWLINLLAESLKGLQKQNADAINKIHQSVPLDSPVLKQSLDIVMGLKEFVLAIAKLTPDKRDDAAVQVAFEQVEKAQQAVAQFTEMVKTDDESKKDRDTENT